MTTDYLYTFTGIPSHELLNGVRALLNQREGLEARLLDMLTDKPLEANIGFLCSAAAAFFLAERGVNPRMHTFIDALYYISTCLAVGYADIFPVTQTGKAIATLVMLVGPALTAELLDPPQHAASASEVGQKRIIALLEALLEESRQQSGVRQPTE